MASLVAVSLSFKEVKTRTGFVQRMVLPCDLRRSGDGPTGDTDGDGGRPTTVPCEVGKLTGGPRLPVKFVFDASELLGSGAVYNVGVDGEGWVVAGRVRGGMPEDGKVRVQGVPEEVGRVEGAVVIEVKDKEGKVVGEGEGGRGFVCLPTEGGT